MPNTYATAVGKLNEQSGELTVFKQRDNSLGNTHTSPKSSQYATLFKRGRKPQQAFENSNRDLGRANYTYSEGMFAITAQNQNKSQKRRPQTTKQRPHLRGNKTSGFNLKNDNSVLSSIQDQYTINEVAIARTGNNMAQARGEQMLNKNMILPSGQNSNDEYAQAVNPDDREIGPSPSDYNTENVHGTALQNERNSSGDLGIAVHNKSINNTENKLQTTSQILMAPAVANPKKVLMQVNKYVHPCERIPG